MTTENPKFKGFLSQLPSSLQEEIEDAIEMSTPSSDIDEDYLQMMKEMSPETYETLLKGIKISKNEPIENLKVLFSTKQEKEFELLDDDEEDIIVWEGNYHSEKNITFQNEKIIIINGNITCNNLIVNDSYLFINGNVTCKVLFGASSNDKMTRITLNLKAKSIVENGHYTLVDGEIEAENIVMLHNEIRSNTAIEAKVIFDATEYETNKLNSSILDNEGCFDEEKFLEKINEDADFSILNLNLNTTNTEYNLESVIRIIDSEIVPENKKNGYNFNIGPIDVCVQKPYIDAEGINVGNSIYIDGSIGCEDIQIFIQITNDKKILTILYECESKNITKFQKLDTTTDVEIQKYFKYVFNLITAEIELLEKNQYAHVISLTDYSKQFGKYRIPTELELLLDFQNKFPDYAEGFFLRKEESSNFLSSWCDIEALQTEFCSQIYPFAVANSTGSTYAFWDNGIETELNKMPILIFGDEGGLHLVAKNILALLEQLTFDREIIVYEEEVYFSDDKDDEENTESLYADEFKGFVKKHFAIEPTKDPNKLIENAQNTLKKSFDEWYANYQVKD